MLALNDIGLQNQCLLYLLAFTAYIKPTKALSIRRLNLCAPVGTAPS